MACEADAEETEKKDISDRTISEKHKTDVCTLNVVKEWKDQGHEKERPDSVTVKLYADGHDTGKEVTLDKAGSWKGRFENLPVSKDSKIINYTVKENVPKHYESETAYSDEKKGTGDVWIRTDGFQDGETYLIVTSPEAGNVIGMEIGPKGVKGMLIPVAISGGP